MRILLTLVFVTMLSGSAFAQTEVERNFNTFLRWFSGSWDNEIQTFNENYNKIPDDERHGRIHMVYKAVKSDAFPGVLFVIENYSKEGIRGPLNYMSVHHFYPDTERGAIAHAFLFKKDGNWSYLAEDPQAAADLAPDDVSFNTDCMMYWTKEAGQYIGTTDEGACRVGDNKDLLDATGVLSQSDLWRRDIVLDRDGNILRGHKEFERFRAATYYNCGGRHQDNDGEWVYFQNERVHNQGDFVWLGDENLGVQIRQIIWTNGFFENATALQTFQNGSAKATVNGHGSLQTRYIGIDHPEYVVNCKRS
ncbi:MAG: CpcT/CpeT family chromophore lyase [Rhodospirillaceae bacterium]|nr:CpcT/CpeT family chromophore lyase [Rhodospirillaceae bacterium]